MQGYVKVFFHEKGYGFIAGQDGNDYFVHHSNIIAEGFRTLEADEQVEFEIAQTERGPNAVNVRAIGR